MIGVALLSQSGHAAAAPTSILWLGSDPITNSDGFAKRNADANTYGDTYNYTKCNANSYSDAECHT